MIYFKYMSFLSKFFGEEDSSALGIDIGSSAIKIVEIKRFFQAE